MKKVLEVDIKKVIKKVFKVDVKKVMNRAYVPLTSLSLPFNFPLTSLKKPHMSL